MADPRGESDRRPAYTIGVVERLTGLSARQIRYYEAKGLVSPVRSGGNQRLFSKYEVRILKEVRALRDQQLPLEAIAALLRLNYGKDDGQ